MKVQSVSSLILALACVALSEAGGLLAGAPITKIESTVKIHEAYHFGWFPSVRQLSTGELICDFSLDGDVHDLENSWWGFMVSSDGGRTWGMRNTAGMVFRENSYSPPLPDGSLLVMSGYPTASKTGGMRNLRAVSIQFSKRGDSILLQRDVQIILPKPAHRQALSEDLGDNKSRPAGPARFREAAAMLFSGNLVDDSKGGWLSPMYGRFEGDKHFRTIIVRADRDGKKWNYVGTVAGDSEREESMLKEKESKSEGFTEPCMLRLKDGRLLIVMRRGGDNIMYKSWSTDDGATWSKPSSLGFKGVEPVMIQMKNGLLALSTGRPGPIGIHFSADDGKTWSERTVVADFPGKTDAGIPNHKQLSTCYTGMVEVEPGRLLVVYDHLPNVGGWGMNPADKPGAVNTIYGTFVKVTR